MRLGGRINQPTAAAAAGLLQAVPSARRWLAVSAASRIVPNLLTLLALCAGMTAIRFAINGDFQRSVFALIAAGIFDGLDGRAARLLGATSPFGAELDSLSDFISFGVAPATVLYLWTMAEWHSIGWVISLFFAMCCALRLARFNTQLTVEKPPYATNFFSGTPAPAGAGLAILPMLIAFEWGDWLVRSPYCNGVWIAVVSVMMVSTLPTISIKQVHVPPRFIAPALLGAGLMTALFAAAPWLTLALVGAVYLGSVPVTVLIGLRKRREFE